jgi:hypothetical protein
MVHLYALPISGGFFPSQLAMVEWMNESKIIPDICLASSGGNVTAYIAMASQWNSASMRKIIPYLSNKIFVRSWFPDYLPYLPSLLRGYFLGSFLNVSSRFYTFFNTLFNSTTVQRTEIWSGTFNKSRGMTQLFCNKGQGTSMVHDDNKSNNELLNYLPFTYLDGDLENLAKVCFASAAVPVVFPPIIIRGESHTDGGNSFSSPLTPMKDALITSFKGQTLHLTYITPHNINAPKLDVCYPPVEGGVEKMNLAANYGNATTAGGSMYSQGKYAISELLKSSYLQDRLAGLEVVGITVKSLFIEKIVSLEEFIQLQQSRLKTHRSFMEIYPLNDKNISIVDFTGQDILDIMNSQTHVGVRLWTL